MSLGRHRAHRWVMFLWPGGRVDGCGQHDWNARWIVDRGPWMMITGYLLSVDGADDGARTMGDGRWARGAG